MQLFIAKRANQTPLSQRLDLQKTQSEDSLFLNMRNKLT